MPANRQRLWMFRARLIVGALGLVMVAGCTTFKEFVDNGFKVGPNYQRPPAPLTNEWIEAADPRVKSTPANYCDWWTAFRDPVLDGLVRAAYEQNVTLKIAGTRVLEARAQRAIAVGTLFPQSQTANGEFDHTQTSKNVANPLPNRFFDTWSSNFAASWEIDFWGRFRRSIESADDIVESSVDDYDNVMVSLIGDLAAAYVQYRTFEQQIVYTRENVRIQSESLRIANDRWRAGQTNELSVVQATSLFQQLEASIPVLEIGMRTANNQMCILLGMPPADLDIRLGVAAIPTSPPEVVVGIPADLIRRRPDLRSAERQVAAQTAQIGVAEANFYPAFFINGTIGYQANSLSKLVSPHSFVSDIGPGFQWQILNYGRILNNVRFQDFKTQELVGVYQQKVLSAAGEVENGIVAYLRSQQEAAHLRQSVVAAARAVAIANAQYRAGAIDYTPVFVAQQFLVQQQNAYAQSQGDIALGLIGVYRAIGGGWEYRLSDPANDPCPRPASAAASRPTDTPHGPTVVVEFSRD